MRQLRFIVIAFVTVLFVTNAVLWRKAIAVLLCGILSFNSSSCYSFLSQGTLANAATPVNISTVPSKSSHIPASAPTIFVDAQRNLIVAASPSTVSLVGKWKSNWGLVEFNSNLTGRWNQGSGKIGQITSGSYDPKTRKLVFQYYQSWNDMNGTATLTLSEDGNRFSGTWTQQRGSNRPGSGGSGGWTMVRDSLERKHNPSKGSDLTTIITKWENIIPGIVGWPTNLPQPIGHTGQVEVDNGWAVNLTAVVTVKVQNQSNVDAPASNLTIKLQKDDNTAELKTVPINSLPPGQEVQIQVQLKFNPDVSQDFYFFGDAVIIAEVDSSNLISEANESNNRSTRKILLADPRPDCRLEGV
jgi:hypothetical protein